SMPFENPALLTNFLQILSMMLIPSACVVAFGLMVYHRKERQGFALMGKEGGVIFGAMGIIFIISLLLIYFSEKMSNPNVGGKIKCRKRKIKCRIFATNYLSFNLKLKL
ncbi:TPA: potassium-transporting ATPase subunit KdpA, partial [Campylobacter jejuni]